MSHVAVMVYNSFCVNLPNFCNSISNETAKKMGIIEKGISRLSDGNYWDYNKRKTICVE